MRRQGPSRGTIHALKPDEWCGVLRALIAANPSQRAGILAFARRKSATINRVSSLRSRITLLLLVLASAVSASGQAPAVAAGGVVNAASLLSGPVAPGSTAVILGTGLIVSVFGDNLGEFHAKRPHSPSAHQPA